MYMKTTSEIIANAISLLCLTIPFDPGPANRGSKARAHRVATPERGAGTEHAPPGNSQVPGERSESDWCQPETVRCLTGALQKQSVC